MRGYLTYNIFTVLFHKEPLFAWRCGKQLCVNVWNYWLAIQLKTWTRGQRDGSAGKGICHPDRQFEVLSLIHMVEGKKWPLQAVLTYTCVQWHTHNCNKTTKLPALLRESRKLSKGAWCSLVSFWTPLNLPVLLDLWVSVGYQCQLLTDKG